MSMTFTHRRSALAGVLLLFCVQAHAGEVFEHRPYWSPDANQVTIKLTSLISAGDVGRIRAAIKQAKADGRTVLAVELESIGGDGNAGMALADFIHKSKIPVFVAYTCYSSCATAALSALKAGGLLISRYTKIGVHAAEDVLTGDPMPRWTNTLAKKMRRYGAPAEVVTAMVDTPYDRMAIFDADQLVKFGAEVREAHW